MTPFLIAIAIVLLVVALELLLAVGKRVVVTTRQGDSIRGTRQLTLKPVIALSDCEILEPGGSTQVKGRIEIPFRNVAMTQRLGGGA